MRTPVKPLILCEFFQAGSKKSFSANFSSVKFSEAQVDRLRASRYVLMNCGEEWAEWQRSKFVD